MGVYLGTSPISLYLGGQNEGEDIQPELTEQEALIQQIEESLVGKAYGANATPETILKGYSAYVHQELVEGTMEPISGIDFGKVTLTSDVAQVTVNHSLGKVPSFALLVPIPLLKSTNAYTGGINVNGKNYGTSGAATGNINVRNASLSIDQTQIVFNCRDDISDAKYAAGTYYWFALA